MTKDDVSNVLSINDLFRTKNTLIVAREELIYFENISKDNVQ